MNNSRTYKLSPQAEENTEYSKSGVTTKDFKVLRKAVDGTNSSLQVLSNQIDLKVSNTDIINRINLSTEGILIQANRLTLSGLVTFSNLSTAGQTTINGGNIMAGTITALGNVTAGSFNIGSGAFQVTSGGVLTASSANITGNITATSGTIGGWSVGSNLTRNGITFGNDYISFSNQGTGGSTINMGSAKIYNQGGNTIAISGALYAGTSLQVNGQTTSQSIIPSSNNTYSLGTSSFRWATIYQTSGAVTGSDKVLKKDIQPIDESIEFIKALKPVSYVMKDGSSGRTHYGFIAQEVKQALDKIG